MRYGRRYADDYASDYYAGSGGQHARREDRGMRLSWRQWLALVLGAVLLVGCGIGILFLVALVHDPRGTSDRMTALFQESVTTAAIALPVVAVLGLLLFTRHVWYAWLVKPVHARDDRLPTLIDAQGRVRVLDDQRPRLRELRSIHAGNQSMPLLESSTDTSLLAAPEEQLIPQRGTWESVKSGVRAGHYFLGWTVQGELWGSLEALLTMFAAGQQGFGKTGLARLLVLQAKMTGAEVVIWDWYNDIAREAKDYLAHCYYEADDVEQSAQSIAALMEERHTLYKTGKQLVFPELFIVGDEWGQYEGACPMAKKVISDGLEWGRKVGTRFYISSVRLPAKSVGPALSKGNVATTFVFITSTQAASQFEITGAQGELLMRALFKAGKGYCIIRSARLGLEGSILALPEIKPEVFQAELSRLTSRNAFGLPESRLPLAAPTPAYLDALPILPPLPPNPRQSQQAAASAVPVSGSLSVSAPGGKILTMPVPTPLATTQRDRETERIRQTVLAHPDWKPARIYVELGYRDHNLHSLIKVVRDKLIEEAQTAMAQAREEDADGTDGD